MLKLLNKARRARTLLILLACAILVVLLSTLWREREPQYQGHSLSEWIALFNGGYDRDPDITKHDAELAIRAIGTNALPFLVKWLNYRERPWRTRLDALCNKLPDWIGNPLSNLGAERTGYRQESAYYALCLLGAKATPAIPALTNLLSNSPRFADLCLMALVQLGDDGLPPVLGVLTNRASPVRSSAIYALWNPDAKYTFTPAVAEVVTSCLDDPDPELPYVAATILCAHHVNEERAIRKFIEALEGSDAYRKRIAASRITGVLQSYSVTNLIQALQNTNSALSPYAAIALAGKNEPNRNIIVSVLINSLADPRPMVRSFSINALGQMRPAAESAALPLLDLWNDPDQSVRESATNAFFEVPPYYHLRTAVEWPPFGMTREQAELYAQRYRVAPYSNILVYLLQNPDPRIREMATNAFQKLGQTADENR